MKSVGLIIRPVQCERPLNQRAFTLHVLFTKLTSWPVYMHFKRD